VTVTVVGLSEVEARILDRISAADLVADATRLIAAGGENPGDTEQAGQEVLADLCRAAGGRPVVTEFLPGRPNLLARFGSGGGPPVLFLGHSDVVPAGVGWDRSPFAATVAGGRLVGRGAADMKGGLAAVVAALRAIAAEGLAPRVDLLSTGDEEDRALGVQHHLRSGEAGGGGYLACLVAEPTDLAVVTAARGAANLVLRIHGQAAHAGNPDDGRSAIVAGAEVVRLVTDEHRAWWAAPPPAPVGRSSWNVGLIQGGTGTSIVADSCVLHLDRRLLPGEDADAVLVDLLDRARATDAFADGVSAEGEVDMFMPGFTTDPGSRLVGTLLGCLSDAGGQPVTAVSTGAFEAGFIAEHHGCPTVVLGPGDARGQAHRANESVDVADLVLAARLYALFVLRAASLAGESAVPG
jgi:acetylornithine deacetylase/succinyl-diaminopimelate desuccinylase-like protein